MLYAVYLSYFGAFNNYVDKKGWVDGQPNFYVCQCWVGGWSMQCLRRHFLILCLEKYPTTFEANVVVLDESDSDVQKYKDI